jgi:hypothetical protein
MQLRKFFTLVVVTVSTVLHILLLSAFSYLAYGAIDMDIFTYFQTFTSKNHTLLFRDEENVTNK